jgi:hypothetical protein
MKILIPLGTGSCWDDNNELRYCLRSIEQNLKGSYEIEIYGDAPEWVTNVTVVKTERYYPEWLKEENAKNKKGLDYENFFDTLNKVKTFAQNNEGKFLYMYDDVLVIREINIDDIKNIPMEVEQPKYYHTRKHEKHGRTINKAVDIIRTYKKLIYNYETHLPRVYNCQNIQQIIGVHDFSKMDIPYSLATLYFNYYPEEASTDIEIIKAIKAGFYMDDEKIDSYMSGSLPEIEAAVQGKTFINYHDGGLNCLATDMSGSYYLKEWIMNRFPNKSKYEND